MSIAIVKISMGVYGLLAMGWDAGIPTTYNSMETTHPLAWNDA